jgi:hydroxymethylglutaryl-CoA lyase
VAYVDALSHTGLTDIEVSSFVSPKWVPQLADAELVFEQIERRPGVRYHGAGAHLHGLERAVASRVDVVAVFTAASETFSRKNVNGSIADTLERFCASHRRVAGYRCAVMSPPRSPVRSRVPSIRHGCDRWPSRSVPWAARKSPWATPSGVPVPSQVRRLLEMVLVDVPVERIALHFHDTFGQAVANALAAAEMGVRVFDGKRRWDRRLPVRTRRSRKREYRGLGTRLSRQTGVDPDALASAGQSILNASRPRAAARERHNPTRHRHHADL